MAKGKIMVIEELHGTDNRPYAVGRLGMAYEGIWQRKVIFIEDWFENENDACALAYRLQNL